MGFNFLSRTLDFLTMTLPSSYKLKEKVSVSLEKTAEDYVLAIDSQSWFV